MNSRTTARVLLVALGAGGLGVVAWNVVAPSLTSPAADCLEGTWAIDDESIRSSALAGLGDTAGADPEITIDGDTLMTFRDGVYTADYDQRAEITIVMDDKTVGSRVSVVGVATGSYTATDSEVRVVDIDADDVRQEMAMTLNGVEYDPGDVADLSAASLEADATSTYRCNGDELVLTPVIGGVEKPEQASVHHRR